MADLRATLIAQLQEILDTRETGGGLALTVPGDLFEPEEAALRELAREKLARLAGIIVAHPGLSFYTGRDFNGPESDALDGSLRDKRAGAVRDFLLEQGLVEAPAALGGVSDGAPDLDGVELIIVGELIAGASETGVRRR